MDFGRGINPQASRPIGVRKNWCHPPKQQTRCSGGPLTGGGSVQGGGGGEVPPIQASMITVYSASYTQSLISRIKGKRLLARSFSRECCG